MAIFMAKRIIAGKNGYVEVVTARPDLKAGIDGHLAEKGYGELIVAA